MSHIMKINDKDWQAFDNVRMWDSIFVKIGKDMSKQIVSEKIAFEGKFIRIVNYTLSSSNSSEQHDYECMERGDSVCAIVYHPEKEKYLLRRHCPYKFERHYNAIKM